MMGAWIRAVIVSLMSWLHPGQAYPDPWEASLAIERAATDHHPIPARELATVLAVLFVTEGQADPKAVGQDHFGKSYGGWQVHETTFRYVRERDGDLAGVPDVLFREDVYVGAEVAADLIVESYRVCSARPKEEKLAWYASGGPGCAVPAGLAAAHYRWALVEWANQLHPYFESPDVPYVDRSPESWLSRGGE